MNATIGKIIIWENRPINKSLGWVKILVKSGIFKFKPKENIINAIAKGKKTEEINPITNIITGF